MRKAWDRRGRFRELRTRDQGGPIVFESKYRERPSTALITYRLAIDEDAKGPFVKEEFLAWRRGKQHGKPFKFLNFHDGSGLVIAGENPEKSESENVKSDNRVQETLDSREILAVNTLGQFARHPRVSALRRFITGWYLSYLNADHTRGIPEAGNQERLSATGDNLPNVIQYLREGHPRQLERVLSTLARRVPHLERVEADIMADGRLLLQIKDAPFQRPILSKFASDGTLKMLAYLTLLYDPEPPN